ncbi:uncharacterized protein [Coffea arabica]|uniref:Uncharacterized protein n=1 Tax=Coffea arabica TaxID=13443 RepID=A0A6P6U1U8_COFAR|nr:uncharacterized protein LOC113706361 [Coffea arabica]
MATAPIKSQPLHNFSLPHLRWVHKNSPHQQSPPHSTLQHRRDSPDFDPPGNDNNTTAAASPKPASRTPRKPQPFSSPCLASFPSASSTHQNQKAEQGDDVVEEGHKPWNLRPRKVVTYPTSTATFTTPSSFRKNDKEKEKLQEETGSSLRNSNISNESVLLKSSSSCRVVRGGATVAGYVGGGVACPGFAGTERQQRKVVEEKRKLWISLSKEEIEEDVYSLTGSRPSRRPKKRPRTVQKQLDNVFPGLYLVGLSIDSYRVHDSLR